MPTSVADLAAVSAAICAAKGGDLREPLKPSAPAELHPSTFPCASVTVTIVLLNVERICATPVSILFLIRRFRVFVVLRTIDYLTSFTLFLLIRNRSTWTFTRT